MVGAGHARANPGRGNNSDIGAAGAVGRAATQIAGWKGARVIPAIRAKGAVPAGTIDTLTDDLPRKVRDLTGG